MDGIVAYPRTRHIVGSAPGPSGVRADAVDIASFRGRRIVVEEKLDGAMTWLGWDAGGTAFAGARGTPVDLARRDVGPERHLNRFKDWATAHDDRLLAAFEDRYLPHGEWCQSAHTAFYDALPHLWFEFDVYDRSIEGFLGTDERRALVVGLPVVQVPVLYDGPADSLEHLLSLVSVPADPSTGRDLTWTEASLYKTADWRGSLAEALRREGLDPDRNAARFEPSRAAEGLYVKVEEDGRVVERLKLVRSGFLAGIAAAGGHWRDAPPVPNRLVPGADILAHDLHWLPGTGTTAPALR